MTLLEELEFRGQLYQITDADGLAERLARGPITLYCGFDPTADSLTVGNLATLLILTRFQRAGHRPIALVGGGTGMIGDPGGKAQERALNTTEVVEEFARKIRAQMEPFLEGFQGAIKKVRYSSKPVVVTTHQRVLGGGCEMTMASPHPVASAETYIGLVELGVGSNWAEAH